MGCRTAEGRGPELKEERDQLSDVLFHKEAAREKKRTQKCLDLVFPLGVLARLQMAE
jgi:hypothetical protein